MSAAGADQAAGQEVAESRSAKYRVAAQGDDPTVLAQVYQDIVNMAVWQRELPAELEGAITSVVESCRVSELSMTVTPGKARAAVHEAMGHAAAPVLSDDIAYLVDMFCSLLGFERAGLRLTTLTQAMCPRFHVDNVPCRFVTTYHGVGTEWLAHAAVDRSRLGRGSNGLADRDSGLYAGESDIRQLNSGDVALLKGELWEGNENAGLVHRSPSVAPGESRLLLTLDVIGS